MKHYTLNTPRCLLLGAALAWLTACGNEPKNSGAPSAVDQLVEGIVEDQILHDVSRFTDSAEALAESAEAFCGSFEQEALLAVQEAWLRTAGTWYRVQLFNFGPADVDPVFPLYSFIDSLRVRGTDYRDGVSVSQEGWRASEDKLDTDFFSKERFNDLGLLALEVSLFEEEKALPVFEGDARRCEILLGLSADLSHRAELLQTGWTRDFDGSDVPFAELLLEGELPNGRAPLVQLLVSAQEYVDYLHSRHVASLAGITSGTTWVLMSEALDAIETLLSNKHSGESLLSWVEKLGGKEPASKIRQDVDAVLVALDAEDVDGFEAALIVLDGDFKRDIPDALGIQLGLTFTDGD